MTQCMLLWICLDVFGALITHFPWHPHEKLKEYLGCVTLKCCWTRLHG